MDLNGSFGFSSSNLAASRRRFERLLRAQNLRQRKAALSAERSFTRSSGAALQRTAASSRRADIRSPPLDALAANGSFSNRGFGSSSFHRLHFRLCGIVVSHPGQASLRSHCWSGSVGPLHACAGSVVEHLASSRDSSGAAAVFGVIHRPRPVRDDPVSDG